MMTNPQNTVPERRIKQEVPVRAPMSRRLNPVRVHPGAEALKRSIRSWTEPGEEEQAAKSDSART